MENINNEEVQDKLVTQWTYDFLTHCFCGNCNEIDFPSEEGTRTFECALSKYDQMERMNEAHKQRWGEEYQL